jgi:hypothetical protein
MSSLSRARRAAAASVAMLSNVCYIQ